jgi:Bacterial Ig-like domain (group 3)
MRITQPRIGVALVAAALVATGVSSMAVAAQSRPAQSECYGVCLGTRLSGVTLTQFTTVVPFGRENLQIFHVLVRALPGARTPTGTVAIKSGATIVCTAVLSNGRGSCSPSPRALPPGFRSVRAFYSGDGTFAPSMSTALTFDVRAIG